MHQRSGDAGQPGDADRQRLDDRGAADLTTTTPPSDPAVITAFHGSAVSPVKPITVSIANGTLTGVTMLNPEGKHVRGEIDADGTTWHNTEVLGYSKTYQITATGVAADGAQVTKRSRITTLTPNNMTLPYLQRIGGYTLDPAPSTASRSSRSFTSTSRSRTEPRRSGPSRSRRRRTSEAAGTGPTTRTCTSARSTTGHRAPR